MKGKLGTWGKLRRDDRDQVIEAWHPLEHHSIDVACCAEALLSRTLLGKRLARLADVAVFDSVSLERLAVLAALHDLGKFNRGFQNKAHQWIQGARLGPTAGHVSEAVWAIGPNKPAAAAIGFLKEWGGDQALFLLHAAISHHGSPAQPSGAPYALWDPQAVRELQAFIEDLTELYPNAFGSDGVPLPSGTRFQHAFAGLIMLADWLGSDTRFFPYSEDPSLVRRLFQAREQAATAVREIGMDVRALRDTAKPAFDRVAAFEANDMQQTVWDLPTCEGPTLAILESETGSGKTEAAFARFLQLFHAGEVDGMYFALPTRTAATHLHERAHRFARRAFGDAAPPVILAVPGYLQVDDVSGRALPRFEILWNDQEWKRYRHRGWAAERPKRYLAGAIVVGTIDQALLAALKTDHAHLRATALLRQLLVVDEVHASDAYMTRILEHVLGHHLDGGGHAFLMSATLGSSARVGLQRLLHETEQPAFSAALATAYPRVGLLTATATSEHPVSATAAYRKWLDWELAPTAGQPDEVVTQAIAAARGGARVLIVRNTVGDCVGTVKELDARAPELSFQVPAPERPLPVPHHGRFAKPDREVLDAAIEETFGRRSERSGVIAVGTQTVEQSLDLDADLLITDLCPMDVLLQRVGRLHRHPSRERPAGFERARVLVLTPPERDLSPLLERGDRVYGPFGFGTVYGDLSVLEATWRLIEKRRCVVIPDANRELVEGATHPDTLAELRAELGPTWQAHGQVGTGKRLSERQLGRLNAVSWERPFYEELFPDDRKTPTRLGLSDRQVALTSVAQSPFGAELRELSIPGFIAERLTLGEEPTTAVHPDPDDEHALLFDVGGGRFRYSRFGLEMLE